MALPHINNKARRDKSGNVKTEEVVYAVREVAADRSLDTGLACVATSRYSPAACNVTKSNARSRSLSSVVALDLCLIHSLSTRKPPVWYVIEGYDGEQVLAKRLSARAAHLARLQALLDQGRLLLAGPCPAIDAEDPGDAGFSGSVVIADFEDLSAARAWAEADPYVEAGVYARVEVRPFRKVLP